MYDAIVIGGGFYGSAIAVYLAERRGLSRVALIEKEPALFTHASRNNQARVHNGYHYPRSFTTGFRSRANLPRFLKDYSGCITNGLTTLYAISRKNSKVSVKQFQRFCNEIGADLKPAPVALKKLFTPNFIEELFLVEEYVFDTEKLRSQIQQQLNQHHIEIFLKTTVKNIHRLPDEKALQITCENDIAAAPSIATKLIFNCTYSGINQFSGDFIETQSSIKHEIIEMPLIQVPAELQRVGLTIMDGPFFSIMPYPSEGLHTLSHVRYTPHFSWKDQAHINPYQEFNNYNGKTRVDLMIRDSIRYLPIMARVKYVKSLFGVKTTLINNENDDGRPILFEKFAKLPGFYSILGGKIDNIYDILEKLDAEPL